MKKYVLLVIYVAIFPLFLYLLIRPILSNIAGLLLYYTLIVFNTLTIVKIVLDYIRYKDKMNPFRKIDRFTNNDIIISELSKLNTYQKNLVINNNLIIINEAGIFEFVRLNKQGALKGDIKDEFWYINNKKMKNPFILKEGAFNYIVLNSNIKIEVSGVWLTTRKLLYNTVDKRLNKRIYNREQIEIIYNKLSNDVKL